MEISLNGKNAFLVKTTSGAVICDPSTDEEARFVPSSAADDTVVTAVLSSLPAKSTFQKSVRAGSAEVISHPGEYEIGDLGLRGVALPVQAESKKTVTSFRIDAEGLAVYMLGRPEVSPDSRTVQIIGHVDVLLLDAARLEMDVKELSSLIGALDPSIVFANGLDAETNERSPMLTALLGEAGSDQASKEPQPRVSVTKSNLPSDRQLVVLRPRAAGS